MWIDMERLDRGEEVVLCGSGKGPGKTNYAIHFGGGRGAIHKTLRANHTTTRAQKHKEECN